MIQTDEIDVLEEAIRKVKNKYDQFFAGISKLPPSEDRRRVEATIHELNRIKFRDNARRFRFNSLLGRYNQYRELWARRMREREEGPIEYKKRRAALTEPPKASGQAPPAMPHEKPSETLAPAGSYVKVTTGTNGDAVKTLFAQINDESRKLGKDSGLTLEQVAAMVQKQSESLRSKYQVDAVAFRVETVDGKVKLKAKPVQS